MKACLLWCTSLFLLIGLAPVSAQNVQPPNPEGAYIVKPSEPIAAIGLSENEISDILSGVISRMQDHDIARKNLNLVPDALSNELLASHVDMGSGTENGLAVRGSNDLCSPTGNCLVWFFKKAGGKWQLLELTGAMAEDDGEAASFWFAPPPHNGLYDLVLQTHMSASEAPMTVWQFDGASYELVKNYTDCAGQVVEGGCPHPAGSKTISTTVDSGGQGRSTTGIMAGPATISCASATTDSVTGTSACYVFFRPEFGADLTEPIPQGKSVEVNGPGHVTLTCKGQGERLTCSLRIEQKAILQKQLAP